MKQKYVYDDILDRNELTKKITNILNNFEENKHIFKIKRGIYLYGDTGIGKSKYINDLLNNLDYDVIHYNSCDIRNKIVIEQITKYNSSDKNVLSYFSKNKKPKRIAIIMDEIDGMNNGDKGGLNALIKLIRPKKTKNQKLEQICNIPIICIGSYDVDKKINELKKVSHDLEFVKPTNEQIESILNKYTNNLNKYIIDRIVKYVNCNLNKITSLLNIYNNDNIAFEKNIMNTIDNIFICKNSHTNTKKICSNLIHNKYNISKHNELIPDTDRTIISLLLHENIIDILDKYKKEISVNVYLKLLNNFSYFDYIDRITFQKQIWIFNEMSSLMKLFYSNKIMNDLYNLSNKNNKINSIRFTKILTKYSTEYNNFVFIKKICDVIYLDKNNLFKLFINLKKIHDIEYIYKKFKKYNDISILDINRLYRYLDKIYVTPFNI